MCKDAARERTELIAALEHADQTPFTISERSFNEQTRHAGIVHFTGLKLCNPLFTMRVKSGRENHQIRLKLIDFRQPNVLHHIADLFSAGTGRER